MTINGVKREILRLRRKLGEDERAFRAPPLDEDGLPLWDAASEPLTVEGYMRALGFEATEELTEPEADARDRLSPYRALFERLGREKAEEEPVR